MPPPLQVCTARDLHVIEIGRNFGEGGVEQNGGLATRDYVCIGEMIPMLHKHQCAVIGHIYTVSFQYAVIKKLSVNCTSLYHRATHFSAQLANANAAELES